MSTAVSLNIFMTAALTGGFSYVMVIFTNRRHPMPRQTTANEITPEFRKIDQARKDARTVANDLTQAIASEGDERAFHVDAAIKRGEFLLTALRSLKAA